MRHGIVPPYLLTHLSELDREDLREAAEAARRALLSPLPTRPAAPTAIPGDPPSAVKPTAPDRTISDAGGTETLPGDVVRVEGAAPTGDPATDEAYDGLGATYALFAKAFGRASIDGAGLPLLASVHYGSQYDNAFWDGGQMVFGDGDGQVFGRFTASLSVIGHELSHGVTQYTANLTYQGQSGALNESVSDVFGALVEQHARSQSAAEASWLIGEGLFTDQVEGNALRSMKEPGTAYDDDVLGKDPQPGHMDDYVETTEDNGGVHLNSGIPNKAFYLMATALGGNAWEAAGSIWYDTLTSSLSPDASFAAFAAATANAASSRFGDRTAEHLAVLDAWSTVGLPIGATDTGTGTASQATGDGVTTAVPFVISVVRSGGFAGLRREWTIEVSAPDEAERWLPIIEACPWDEVGGQVRPDGFIYDMRADRHSAVVPEQELHGPWQQLVDEVQRWAAPGR